MNAFLLKLSSIAIAGSIASAANAGDLMRPIPSVGISNAPVVQVQSGDAIFRVNELEERVRALNGKVEELTFQLLQMQEEMRRMQQDNELRFQELEEKSGSLESDDSKLVAKADNAPQEQDRLGKPAPSKGETLDVKPEQPEKAPEKTVDLGPKALGTLTFDSKGNVIDAGRANKGKNAALDVFNNGTEGSVDAAEFGATPDEVFAAGRTAYDKRNYKRSQQAFRAFIKAWPKAPKGGEARYYLGQSLFWQSDYLNAANMFLDTHNAYPEAETAPDNLLGLGLALAGLNQREVACVTYSEVLKQYPEATNRLADQIQAEQSSAKC